MQKVAKEYMSTMKAAAVQARLKAGQSPMKATATTIASPDIIKQCFAARDGRLLGLLVRYSHSPNTLSAFLIMFCTLITGASTVLKCKLPGVLSCLAVHAGVWDHCCPVSAHPWVQFGG